MKILQLAIFEDMVIDYITLNKRIKAKSKKKVNGGGIH